MIRKAQKGPDVRRNWRGGGEEKYSENRLRTVCVLAHGIAAPCHNYEKWGCRRQLRPPNMPNGPPFGPFPAKDPTAATSEL